jgi:hypothetical protein
MVKTYLNLIEAKLSAISQYVNGSLMEQTQSLFITVRPIDKEKKNEIKPFKDGIHSYCFASK